jgi:hypothetical protein
MPITSLLLAAALGQVFDPAPPATDDRAALFARSYLAFIKADPKKAGAARRLPTTFFYGKARTLMAYPQGPWEQAHLGVCRQMLDLLDTRSAKEIKRIQDANPNRQTYHISAEDRAVFDERFSDLMGFEDPETTELEKWTSSAGYALGELATVLITWHYMGADKLGQEKFHAALDRVKERAKAAPKGSDPTMAAQMASIAQVGKKERYTIEELAMIAKRIEFSLSTIIPPGSK